ncbi:MAG: hypothetical protein WBV82_29325 [Myxococcaceae bacterium]
MTLTASVEPIQKPPESARAVLPESARALQLLWLQVAQRPWSSLLLVPTHAGASTFDFAVRLTEVGRNSTTTRLVLADARSVSLESVLRVKEGIATHVGQGARILVLVDPVVENPATLEIARVTDAALLCITYGQTDVDTARRTLDLCGRELFLGSVAVHAPTK